MKKILIILLLTFIYTFLFSNESITNKKDNLIKNGDFPISNDNNWLFWAENLLGYFHSFTDDEAVITISENKKGLHIDFYQTGLLLKKGETYRVKFQVKALTIKNIEVLIQQVERD